MQTVLDGHALESLRLSTLSRQMLLERADAGVLDALGRLAGLNAQHRRSPYIALWSRLRAFQRSDLETALTAGHVVKATLMRGTLHLVPAEAHTSYFIGLTDARERALRSFFPRVAASIDGDRLRGILRPKLSTASMAFRELERVLQPHFPEAPPQSLSFAAKSLAPLGQTPPSAAFAAGGAPMYRWVDFASGIRPEGAQEFLFDRYLRAFGPATLQDFAQWSGLGLKEAEAVRARLGDRLEELAWGSVTYLDIPGLPPPADSTRPPVRLLPRWDNLLLAYKDRTRILPKDLQHKVIMRDGRVLATFLAEGEVAGTWAVEESVRQCTVVLLPLRKLSAQVLDDVRQEADALARWLCPEGSAGHRLAT